MTFYADILLLSMWPLLIILSRLYSIVQKAMKHPISMLFRFCNWAMCSTYVCMWYKFRVVELHFVQDGEKAWWSQDLKLKCFYRQFSADKSVSELKICHSNNIWTSWFSQALFYAQKSQNMKADKRASKDEKSSNWKKSTIVLSFTMSHRTSLSSL